MLRNMGERGLLAQFPAVVVGTAEGQRASSGRRHRRSGTSTGPSSGPRSCERCDAYNPDAMVVFDVDIGHTDPQWVLPYGGTHDRRRPGAPHHRALLTDQKGSVMSSAQLYDTIGATYTVTRRTEPRIAAQIWAALGDARTVLNVGAGTGSYEPPDRHVLAVEPSALMRSQRPADAAPCLAGSAESLPFDDQSFDAAMAVCHRSSLAGPDRRPARDAARRSPRGGVHARHQ